MDIVKNIAIIFLSIFFESLPFLLLGAFISAIIEVFVPNDVIVKIIPKNKVLGALVGVFLGFFLPACDCAVIPISKRLIKKEVPINVAVAFMLASPIINPVVLLSTYTAFYRSDAYIFWLRLGLGIIISLTIGIIMGLIFNNKPVVLNGFLDDECECEHKHHLKGIKEYVFAIIHHAGEDFFDVLKYLMFGAFLASCFQVLLPRSVLLLFQESSILSIIVLMTFAYLISLCSTSDSFVGKSLVSCFGNSAILAYLLIGPMIDIKNTIVLFGNYKRKFVTSLIFLIFIFVFVASMAVMLL